MTQPQTETQTQDLACALDLAPLAGRIGAEVRGVALSASLEAGTLAALHAALLRHKVLFLRGQQHLDDAGQEAFAQRLGEPVAHPTVPSRPGTASVLELDSQHGGRANSWHTDVTFAHAPPKISVLRGVVIPPVGGDTVWANTVTAYLDLPAPLRSLADQLRAVHSNQYDYAQQRSPDEVSQEAVRRYREVFTSTLYETEHPVVRVHPETGERSLVLGHFAQRLQGFNSQDSDHLLAALQAHAVRLENTVRWRWRAGDVVIWDNRATQHYAINDYSDQHRVVRRVTLAGDVPVGVDGRPSVALTAAPKASTPAAAVAA